VIIFKRSIGQCNIGTARAWDISLKTLKNAKVASILSHPGVSDHSKKSSSILLNLSQIITQKLQDWEKAFSSIILRVYRHQKRVSFVVVVVVLVPPIP